MSRLVQAPMISFQCKSCNAVSEDDAENFTKCNTMPPLWTNKCAYCGGTVTCAPSALIAKEVNSNANSYSGYLHGRL